MKTNTIRKHITKFVALAGLSLAIAIPQTANAAAYIKIGDIQGEATASDHNEWITLSSVSMGIHRPGGGATGQTRRRGAVVIDDLSFSKELDKATPKLQEACLMGEVIPLVELELTRTFGDREVVYLKIELKKVLITGSQFHHDENQGAAGTSSEPVSTEDISLNYEEIKVTYTQLDAEGGVVSVVEYDWKVEEGAS